METVPPKAHMGRRLRPKVPKSQRRRVERACTRCRARKRKCHFSRLDVCENCRRGGYSCVLELVDAAAELAGLPYSSHLLDPGLRETENQFRLEHPEVSLQLDHWKTLARLFDHRVGASNDPTYELFPHHKSGTPDFSHHKGNTLLDELPMRAHQGQSESYGFGTFLTSASTTLSQNRRLDLTEDRIGYGFPLDYTLLYNTPKEQYLHDILAGFPTKDEADFIISTFFLYASPNWYCLDETLFRLRVTYLYEHNLDALRIECDFLYLILMVFALGSQFIELRQLPTPLAKAISSTSATGPPGVHFVRSAVKLLAIVLSVPSLESCQGLFLTGLYYLPMSQSCVSYTYLVLSMRVAIGLGLHRNDTGPDLSRKQMEYQHRIFWTLYCTERRLGVTLGYPETIQEKEIKCPLPKFCRDLDSKNDFQGERLISYVNLTMIINRLTQKDKHSWSDYLHDARTAILSWREGIPIEIRSLDSVRLRANAHLHIYYHQVWIYVGRECLIHLVRERLRNKPLPTHGASDDHNRAVEVLTRHCVESASEMINILNILRTQKQLSHFSFTDFHSCVLATIILLLGSILHPSTAILHQVQAAIDTLRFMATGNENAQAGVHLVDSFLIIVNNSLSSLCARQSPGRLSDEEVEENGGEKQQHQRHDPSPSQTQVPTQNSSPFVQTIPVCSPATVPAHIGEAYQRQSPESPDTSLYDRFLAAVTQCSSDDLRFLGISGLFDGDSPQVTGGGN
ncbi:fungal-specific transcription factor domain-containing protein [Aspergillus pseudoustus]|uniref:Fungal-specific transcription factor domain-containing protein n=1 Tax=Aspergillus pseudoustus TaxID=1810923 RepID=A0ABR4JYN4_9EURO